MDWNVETRPRCPWCDAMLDGAASVAHEQGPREGALTLCLYCTGPAIYEKGLVLRRMTEEELTRLRVEDPDTWTLFCRTQEIMRRHPVSEERKARARRLK
jgi:hypothetical protein